jgi:hypothetical protein
MSGKSRKAQIWIFFVTDLFHDMLLHSQYGQPQTTILQTCEEYCYTLDGLELEVDDSLLQETP